MKKIILVLVAVFALATAACTTVDIAVDSRANEAMFNTPTDRSYSVLGSFSETRRVWFTLGGLISLNHVDVGQIVTSAIERYDGDAAVNIRVRDQRSGIDILIGLGVGIAGAGGATLVAGGDYTFASLGASLAGFLLDSRTVTIQGDVVRWEE